jgi:predicted ATP-grasp superfamily ATP-dependent carboligase
VKPKQSIITPKSKPQPRVLVIDANQRSALATVRSLGRKGIHVQTADETPKALAGSSKYSQKYHQYPTPYLDTQAFLDHLKHIIETEQIGVILPMTEVTSRLLLEEQLVTKQTLADHSPTLATVAPPFAPFDVVMRLADKISLYQLATELDLPHPRSQCFESATQLKEQHLKHTFPLVLKPGLSKILRDGLWHSTTVRVANNTQELSQLLDSSTDYASPFMLQEYIEGQGQGIFALYDQGEAVCFFAHRRLREKPPWGGVSVLSESIEPNPRMLAMSKTLLDHVGWHGVAMVEFKVAEDGTPYIMEVNTRFWGSLQLAIDSGVDFPYLLYQIAAGEKPDKVGKSVIGQKLRWLLGDLDSLYIALKDSRYSGAQKRSRIRQFITPNLKQTQHEIYRRHDPAPASFELKQYLTQLKNGT